MEVALSRDPTDFVRRDWSGAVAADEWGTFFQTPRYLKLYWEEFGESLDLLLGIGGEEVRPRAAIALERSGPTLRFLGGTEVTDYMGPVSAPAEREAFTSGLVEALAKEPDWSVADLRGLPEGSPWLELLAKSAAAHGFWEQVEEDDVTPRLVLPGNWDEYLAELPSKLRHEIRRKQRKLEAETGGYVVRFATAETLGEDFDRFTVLHRSSEGPKGKFMQPGMEIFFRRLGEAFVEGGIFRLAFIEAGGERIAGAIGFVYGGTFSLYNSAFDHEWKPLSPGMVLVGELVKRSIEEGCRTFDMLKGDLAYKYRFGAEPRKLMRLQIAKRD